MARDWSSAPLSAADRALCAHAVKLTREPAATTRDDLDRLREHGFEDRAIHDATQIVGYFNYITRVADGLGIEPEAFIEPWGREEA